MPNDDYIKRSDAIAKMSELPFLDEELDIPYAEEVIMKIPAADVEPVRHGSWIWYGEGYDCSECKKWVDGDIRYSFEERTPFLPVYCPFFGAKMDKDEEDNEP